MTDGDDGDLRRRVPNDPDDPGDAADAVEVRELEGGGAAAGDPASIDLSEHPDHRVWRNLWFIRLPEETELKEPKGYPWGGYSTDFASNADVYSAEDVVQSSHSRWGVVGYNTPDAAPSDPQLLIADLDFYEDGAPDRSDINIAAGFAAEVEPVAVESPSGGVHMYMLVDSNADVQESDFSCPDWIDLRGAAVSHHVVAPNSIPGVDTRYEVRNEASIPEFDSFDEACGYICDASGDPLIEYEGRAPSGDVSELDFDGGDAPDDMPVCYERALQARSSEGFRMSHGNPWKVDTIAGQLAVALGYEMDEIVEHFREFAKPGEGFDENVTRNHLRKLMRKIRERDEMTPPTQQTLRSHGILDAGECCGCDLPGHVDPDEDDVSEYYRYLDVQTDSDREMLRRCLALRDEHDELEGEKPPHAAIREIARLCELPIDDDGVVHEMYDLARSQYESMTADDLDEVMG